MFPSVFCIYFVILQVYALAPSCMRTALLGLSAPPGCDQISHWGRVYMLLVGGFLWSDDAQTDGISWGLTTLCDRHSLYLSV